MGKTKRTMFRPSTPPKNGNPQDSNHPAEAFRLKSLDTHRPSGKCLGSIKSARQLYLQNHEGDPRKRTVGNKATDDFVTNRAKARDKPLLNLGFTMGVGPQYSNYERFNCNSINIHSWSWYYRGCWHQTFPPIADLGNV